MLDQTNEKIFRTDIAAWYGISERALRNRLTKCDVHITNRTLTIDDIRTMLAALGKPLYMPDEYHDLFFVT